MKRGQTLWKSINSSDRLARIVMVLASLIISNIGRLIWNDSKYITGFAIMELGIYLLLSGIENT